LRDDLFRKHVAERKLSFLKKLPSKETHLSLQPSMARISHREGLLAGDGVSRNTICAREASFT
jgi:hypothetical protein